MNHFYSGLIDKSHFALTDFNCSFFNERLGVGDYYKIIWATEKDISIAIDGYNITLKKNHLLFCTPSNTVSVERYTEGAISYAFSKEFYCMRDHSRKLSRQDYLFQESFIPPLVKLSENQQQKFEFLFELFQEEFDRKDPFQGEMLMVLLKRLLIMINRLTRQNVPEQKLPNAALSLIREFNYLVETHFRNMHKVSDYAQLLHRSPKSLTNIFLKYNKKSPLKIISERICLEAQRLLMFSDKTVSEIAYDLEFNEASHFSKFFKKHTGTPPKEYKRSRLRMKFEHSLV